MSISAAQSAPLYRTRKAYTERGPMAFNRRKPDRSYEHKLDGDAEACLIKLACSDPQGAAPAGRYSTLSMNSSP